MTDELLPKMITYTITTYKTKVEDHEFWVAENEDGSVVGQGETEIAAIAEMRENEQVYLETIKELAEELEREW